MSRNAPAPPIEGADLSMRRILEALFFASPDPVTSDELVQAFGSDREAEIRGALESLLEEYDSGSRGLSIERVAGGYRITTHPTLADVLREFVRRRNRSRLSKAALETLAMVAYRQPVTAPEIEAVRGVNPSAILKSLLEKRLVRIVGRKKVVGKPFLYGTTPEFLEHFGLNSVEDLPSLDEFSSLLDGAVASVDTRPLGEEEERAGEEQPEPEEGSSPLPLEAPPTPAPASGQKEDA